MPDYNAGNTGDVSVVAATAKSVVSIITGSTRRARIKEIGIGGKSVTATDGPMLVEIVQHDTDGTGTGLTPTKFDAGETAAISTSKENYTVEPTGNIAVRRSWLVPPSQSLILQNPLGEEDVLPISKTTTLRVTAPQNQTVRGYLKFAE